MNRTRSFIVMVVAGALGCAACGGSSSSNHVVTGSRGSTTVETLTVESGITTLAVRSAAIGGELYSVRTPNDAGVRPAVATSGGAVNVQFVSDGHSGSSVATVVLNNAVHWTFRLDGGATSITVNFAAGGFRSIDLASGVSSATINLPRPTGIQTIREDGGASSLTVLAPSNTPTFVRFAGGGGSTDLYGSHYSGIGGGRTFQVAGWSTTHRGFDIELAGGVSSFVLKSS